jgi:hypothetical protein
VRDPRFRPILELVGPDARIGDAEKDGVVINSYMNVPGSVYPQLGWHTDGLRDLFYGRMPQRCSTSAHLDHCTRERAPPIPAATSGGRTMCFRKTSLLSRTLEDPRACVETERAISPCTRFGSGIAPPLAARRGGEPPALDVPAVSHGTVRAEGRRQPDAALPPARRVDARPSRRDVRTADLAVVVAGAGIGGAATALLLARAGARVTLCERVASAVGAGILLQPNGLAVLTGSASPPI